jgi:hypothetical protein
MSSSGKWQKWRGRYLANDAWAVWVMIVLGTVGFISLGLYYPGFDRNTRIFTVILGVAYGIGMPWFIIAETKRERKIYDNWPK